jgi:hypothetical protein
MTLPKIKKILDKVVWSLKAHTHNPMGIIIWNYCQQNEVYIVNYIMGVHHSDEVVQEKITSSVDTTIENGYSLKFSTQSDQLMVNYDLIHVLRNKMGYECWDDLSNVELTHCFKNYCSIKKLPK